MSNIMLGKKEFVPILVVLVCVTIYFLYEYFDNQKRKKVAAEIRENFQSSQMDSKRLDEQREINMALFSRYKDFVIKEKEFFRNDIDIGNYFIKKKFNLDQILRKPRIVNGVRQYVPNPKMTSFLSLRQSYLQGMIEDIDNTIDQIDALGSQNKFYELFKTMLFDIKYIYSDKLTYFTPGNENFFDVEQINNIYMQSSTAPEPGSPTNQASGTDYSYTDLVSVLNTHLITSNKKFKDTTENIEKTTMELVDFIDKSTTIDKTVKNKLMDLIQTRLQVTLKIVVRSLSFNFLETVVLLSLTGNVTEGIVKEKSEAAKSSNVIVGELIDLINIELGNIDEVIVYFRTGKKGSIIQVDNEFKYFNTVDNNTNTLINFCKKMKKMDRPNNNNMIFKRMAREFVKKKNNQIDKLGKDIDQMMSEMSITEAYNHNLYTLRTSDEAQKQINAIKQARDNIDSIGKFKINLK